MWHIRPAALMLTISVVAVAVAGCGGSSRSAPLVRSAPRGSSTTATTAGRRAPLTRAELIARGDVICGRINAFISANPYRTPQDFPRIAPRLAAYEQAADLDLDKLVPPRSLAADWARILADARFLAVQTAKLGKAVEERGLSAVPPMISATQPIQLQMLAIAKHDGFKICSRPG
jgi:hypothetical protein